MTLNRKQDERLKDIALKTNEKTSRFRPTHKTKARNTIKMAVEQSEFLDSDQELSGENAFSL